MDVGGLGNSAEGRPPGDQDGFQPVEASQRMGLIMEKTASVM